MAKYEWSEVFMSIEGEARYSGHPTVYIRFARCNFQCRAFNNPTSKCTTCNGDGRVNLKETGPHQFDGDICSVCNGTGKVNTPDVQPDGYATLGFVPSDYKTLDSIPLIHKGCDSQYAVNPKFAHMWHKGDENDLAAEVLKVLPHGSFVNPESGKRVILSLTGGEPTIRLKFWIPILEKLHEAGMRTILIETNTAAPMRDKDLIELFQWCSNKTAISCTRGNDDVTKIVWSNSPKLAVSGEEWDDAIKPAIAMQQLGISGTSALPLFDSIFLNFSTLEQYFKFVCGPNEEDFVEVARAMEAYYAAGVPRSVDVYIMPMACTEEQQQEVAAKVAHMCMDKGYIYCHRIQNSVFGNGVGT